MTFPVEIGIDGFSISAHLLFETAAFVIGFRYFLYLRRRAGDELPEPNRVWIMIAAALGAFLFSRLIGSLEDPPSFLNSNSKLLYFYSNKTIVGALLGGLLSVELVKLMIHEKRSSGDLFTYPLILAMMIGRIGCFTSGVYEPTYGIETTLPWAMNLGDGKLRHPVALYEIIFLAALWLLLIFVERNYKLVSGVRFKLFMIGYLLFRFLLDFIKPGYRLPIGLTTIQLTCVCGLLYYYHTIYRLVLSPLKLISNER